MSRPSQFRHASLPRYLVALLGSYLVVESPDDGQEGIVATYSLSAAESICRSTPGAIPQEVTPTELLRVCKWAFGEGVPFLYVCDCCASDVFGVRRLHLVALLHPAVPDGQHRHGE